MSEGEKRGAGSPETLRLEKVRAVKILPEETRVVTESGNLTLPAGGERVTLVAGGPVRASLRRPALATFLYYPDGPGAVVLAEEQDGSWTLLVQEKPSSSAEARHRPA